MKTQTNANALPPMTGEQVLDAWLAEMGQPPMEPLTVGVQLKENALAHLLHQLERDINAKARGWTPTGFTLLELLEMEALLSRHPADRESLDAGDNLMLTYPQLSLLACYVGRYYELARWDENSRLLHLLADALDALTTDITFTTTPLPVYAFSSRPHPLAVLWTRLRAVFRGHKTNPVYPASQSSLA